MASPLIKFFDNGDAAMLRMAGEPITLLRRASARKGEPSEVAVKAVVSTIPVTVQSAMGGAQVMYACRMLCAGDAFTLPPKAGDFISYSGYTLRVTKVTRGGIARAWHIMCEPKAQI